MLSNLQKLANTLMVLGYTGLISTGVLIAMWMGWDIETLHPLVLILIFLVVSPCIILMGHAVKREIKDYAG